MSLMRFLTAGRSWVSGDQQTGRYRVTKQRLLPQFGSGKNPFDTAWKAKPVPDVEPVVAPLPVVVPEPEKVSPPTSPFASKAAEQPASTNIGNGPAAKTPAPSPTGTGSARRTTGFGLKSLWPASLFSRKPAQPARSLERRTPGPVQGELSLDLVKVMRNDLSDADLEVKPVSRPVAEPKPVAEPVAEAEVKPEPAPREGAESRWGRMTMFFGAGRS